MNGRKRAWRFLTGTVSVLLAAVFLAPFFYIFFRSFLSTEGFSVQPYYTVLVSTPRYLYRFWKSLGMCLCVVLGQLLVSIPAGYGFGKCDFPGKEPLFFLTLLLMTMPVQVTMVPNFVTLDSLGLLDSYAALILPVVFLPLGTFILRQCFHAIPDGVIDAAMLDGCNPAGILCFIAVPMNVSGLVCVGILSFLDAWNMVEQPIAYLKDFSQYPLSVGLAYAPPSGLAVQLACCLLALLPPLLLFTIFNKDMVDGIALGETK